MTCCRAPARNVPTGRRKGGIRRGIVRVGAWTRTPRVADSRPPKLVVPRCEHVFVSNVSTGRAEHARSIRRSALGGVRPEYRSSSIRVVGYARPGAWARGIIEPVAFRSGTPEHRLDRNAAFSRRCCAAPVANPETNRMNLSVAGAILTRVSAGSPDPANCRRPDSWRRAEPHRENSTSGESCPTQ